MINSLSTEVKAGEILSIMCTNGEYVAIENLILFLFWSFLSGKQRHFMAIIGT